ncbi:putative membrane protein [Microvirus sp.]|nr:putative membrane protein [Microvirus sp.]
MKGNMKWQDALLVVVRALLAGLAALLADTASGQPVAALLAQVHPASLLAGAVLAAPLALLRQSGSSSNTPVRRRSVRASKSTSE